MRTCLVSASGHQLPVNRCFYGNLGMDFIYKSPHNIIVFPASRTESKPSHDMILWVGFPPSGRVHNLGFKMESFSLWERLIFCYEWSVQHDECLITHIPWYINPTWIQQLTVWAPLHLGRNPPCQTIILHSCSTAFPLQDLPGCYMSMISDAEKYVAMSVHLMNLCGITNFSLFLLVLVSPSAPSPLSLARSHCVWPMMGSLVCADSQQMWLRQHGQVTPTGSEQIKMNFCPKAGKVLFLI